MGPYEFDAGQVILAVVAATTVSVAWLVDRYVFGGAGTVPVVVGTWVFLVGLLVALSAERVEG